MRSTYRLFALGALTAGMVATAEAQGRALVVGPTFGLNSAKVTGDNQEEASRRTGLRLGGFASLQVSRNFAIQPEITYTGKGSKWTGENAEIKISYIQVPLLARYRFGLGTSVTPFLMAGPAFALKAGCTLIVDGDEMACNDNTTSVAGSDFGLIFGVGAEIGRAQVSLRYDHGLKNINGDGPANVRNQVLKVSVGYGFRIGG